MRIIAKPRLRAFWGSRKHDAEVAERDLEADVLRELMRSNGLNQPKLARAVGMAQSTISAVLNGTRSLAKEQLVKLAKFFHVSPAAFLPV